MLYKLLLLYILSLSTAYAQSTASSASDTLEAAREAVRQGKHAAAIEQLERLVETGFSSVGTITGDETLTVLSGMPAFDALVENLSRKAYPCEYDEAFSRFDFWLGEWDVFLADGRLAGSNSIGRAEHGCVIEEVWSGAGGSTGRSINFVDKRSGEWVQIWNSAGGSQIEIRGGLTDEGMLLSGTIHYVGSGETYPFRGLWTPLPDGRVRQFFEQSNDGGESWSPWFEGFYARPANGAE